MDPLCFVLMPFGRKSAVGGGTIDFDAVYRDLIAPAVRAADLEPLRADEEQVGGIIHKPMFERLILCDYAVADLTTANGNVLYELGVRHAIKPSSTIALFAQPGQIPFDVNMLRALPYNIGADGKPTQAAADGTALTSHLRSARQRAVDSPVFQLVDGFPDLQRLKTDVFRERVDYSAKIKQQLAAARVKGLDAVRAVEAELAAGPGGISDLDGGVVIDLFLSYRDVKGFAEMIALAATMSRPLAASVLVREQVGLALNRSGRGDEAERLLLEVIVENGASSETCGILGRVYKDRWVAALAAGRGIAARGHLGKAIDTYLQGFEADWRDAYPGVNAVTLMELADPPDPRQLALLPVVRYAVARRMAAGKPDYWDHATAVELAVLASDHDAATASLAAALACDTVSWMRDTTANNLKLIRDARTRRGEEVAWIVEIENELK